MITNDHVGLTNVKTEEKTTRPRLGSNQQPSDVASGALPIELRGRLSFPLLMFGLLLPRPIEAESDLYAMMLAFVLGLPQVSSFLLL